MENTCRTCLNTSIQLLPLFADTKLVAAIETISSIQVSIHLMEIMFISLDHSMQMIEMKNFPNHICEECVNNINFFLMFQQTIITSDQEIRKRLFGESLKIGSESSENLEHQKQMKIEFDFVAVCNNDQEVHKKLFKEILSIKNELPYIKEINDVKFNDNSTEFVGDKDAVLPKSSFKYTQIDTNENEHNYNEITPSKQNRAEANDFNNESAKKFNSNTDISKNNKNVKQKVRKKLCNICGKSVNYYNIGRHIKSHSDVPAKCKICGKISKNAVGLRDHLYTHKAQEITCHICGKVYKCRKHYKIHMEKHDSKYNLAFPSST